MVERTNCLIAGDGFCDTYPDYISSRWNCNTDGESPTLQTDPDGVEFRSDGTLIMSYSDDRCANRFSEDQMAAMRASLLMEKPEVLRNEPPDLPVDPAFVFSPVFPQPGEVIIPENNTFQWDAVDNATHYLIQISRLPSFAVNEFEEIVNTNSAQIENLRSNTKFFWRVRPFNFTSTCANFSSLQNFETSEPTSIQTPSKIAEDLTVFPSPTPEGQQIFVKWTGIDLGQSNFEITDLIGRQVLTGNVDLTSNRVIQIKGSEGLHQGVYFLKVQHKNTWMIKRVMVNN
ncbi:MAG: zinc-dependent metalloprotease [Saprospiraceae bacterium]